MLCGFDDDLAAQTTQASNRIRGQGKITERTFFALKYAHFLFIKYALKCCEILVFNLLM